MKFAFNRQTRLGSKRTVRRRRCRAGLERLEDRAVPATFTVMVPADNGPGTLRQAILDANATTGMDTIAFAIPGAGVQTIRPLSGLPYITDPVVVDGYTQPGTRRNSMADGNDAILLIELDGSLAGPLAGGLDLLTHDSTIRGLVVNRFDNYALAVGWIDGIDQSGNAFEGNFIGTDPTGSIALGNNGQGVLIQFGDRNRVGTDGDGVGDYGERNLISANSDSGVYILGSSSNVVAGNFIGTDASGTRALGIRSHGVTIAYDSSRPHSAYNRVGTNGDGLADAAERNVISGNPGAGVWSNGIYGVVAGNFIGTDVTGTKALCNQSGIVQSAGGRWNRFGTDGNGVADVAERNLISGNALYGVYLGFTAENIVAGNFIGTDITGTGALANGGGVLVESFDNQIGGSTPGMGNRIAYNSSFGIGIRDATSTGNSIRGNSIHANGGLGIDLGLDGVTPNDSLDADTGPNGLQNFPVLSAFNPGATSRVAGSLNSTPNTTFALDFYADDAPDPSGHGEGRRYLGRVEVLTGSDGNAPFDFNLIAPTGPTEWITATATGPDGTSEFSMAVMFSNANPATPTDSDTDADSVAEGVAAGTRVGITASATDLDGTAVTYSLTDDADGRFAIDGTTGVVTVASGARLDGPATHAITVMASDGEGGSSTASFTITVTNADPTATSNAYATLQATAVSGNVIKEDTGSGVDGDPAGGDDPLTVSSFTNPANGTLVLGPDGRFTYTPDSTFTGNDSFTYTISDGDGGSHFATVTITVGAAAPGIIGIIADTCQGGTALLVTGTTADDTIVVVPGPTPSTLTVRLNGVSRTVDRPSGRIIIMGGAGDDDIHIAEAVGNTAWLYGEAGNDKLNAGGGNSLLIGGDGDDQLTGGSGRDVMIGGNGADKLGGNAGDDILVAGYTVIDGRSSPGHEEFWCDVLMEWASSNLFPTRVAKLRTFLLPSVRDDGDTDEVDFLQGSSGNDWIIFASGEDKVAGQTEASDTVN